MPRDGSVTPDQQPRRRVVIGPTKIDGGVSRLVELPDGSGHVETWWPRTGWTRGGTDIAEVLKHPHASTALMDQQDIPENDRDQ